MLSSSFTKCHLLCAIVNNLDMSENINTDEALEESSIISTSHAGKKTAETSDTRMLVPAALNHFRLPSHGGFSLNQIECALWSTASRVTMVSTAARKID